MATSIGSARGSRSLSSAREEDGSIPLRSWPPSILSHHRLSLEAAATVATSLDAARAQAAAEGRTLVYTVRYV